MQNNLKAPFPYFGGKSKIADVVWQRFGIVSNFVDPFFGSGAMLLKAPWPAERTETVNDIDGLLCNFWRALQADPEAVAAAADWPVSELDLHARHRWLVDRRSEVEKLIADPAYYDVKAAGWWVWGISQWIGSGWCPPIGAVSLQTPRLSGAQGVPMDSLRPRELPIQLPHLGDGGQGLHRPTLHRAANADDLWKTRPDLSSAGRGDTSPRLHKKIPELGSARGDTARRLSQQLPELGGDRGVRRRDLHRKRPIIAGRAGGASEGRRPADNGTLIAYFHDLAERLRRVRVICGSWDRVLGPSVTYRHGSTAVFLDPPYPQDDRADVYSHESDVFHKVRAWAIENGNNPLLRIAICGYDFEMPIGWTLVRWKTPGGYGSQGEGRGRENAHKECIWFSPHCLDPQEEAYARFAQPIIAPESDDYGPLWSRPTREREAADTKRERERESAARVLEAGTFAGQEWMEGCLEALVRRGET